VKGSSSLASAFFFFAVWASEVENQTFFWVVLIINIPVSCVPSEEEIKWCAFRRQTERLRLMIAILRTFDPETLELQGAPSVSLEKHAIRFPF
jgi:hypothetical protein